MLKHEQLLYFIECYIRHYPRDKEIHFEGISWGNDGTLDDLRLRLTISFPLSIKEMEGNADEVVDYLASKVREPLGMLRKAIKHSEVEPDGTKFNGRED